MDESNKTTTRHQGWRNLVEWMMHLPQPIASFAAFVRFFGFPGLVGMAFGIICIVMLEYYGLLPNREKSPSPSDTDIVYLVGSGTVRAYLAAANPDLTNRSKIETPDGDIHMLEGATGTGTKLFADTFDQIHILVMASNRRKLVDDLARYPNKNLAVFEAYLGSDPLEIILVAENKFILNKTFSDLISGSEKSELELDSLLKKVWKAEKTWDTIDYDIYASLPPSATRIEWEKRLKKTDKAGKWPGNLKAWEAQTSQEAEVPKASIFLGSEALNRGAILRLRQAQIAYKKLTIVSKTMQVTRDLFLYGRVLSEESKREGINGYDLPVPAANTLRYVYGLLNGAGSARIDADCLQKQIEYFHLDNLKSGWVKKHLDQHNVIYRAEPCSSHKKE